VTPFCSGAASLGVRCPAVHLGLWVLFVWFYLLAKESLQMMFNQGTSIAWVQTACLLRGSQSGCGRGCGTVGLSSGRSRVQPRGYAVRHRVPEGKAGGCLLCDLCPSPRRYTGVDGLSPLRDCLGALLGAPRAITLPICRALRSFLTWAKPPPPWNNLPLSPPR